jgi:sorting nexin-29
MCPIYKKEDRKDCNSYRGIALFNVAYKIFTSCILSRMKETSENVVEYQSGFRPGRSTTDQIFIVRKLLQKI